MRHHLRRPQNHAPAWTLFLFILLALLATALTAHGSTDPDWNVYAADAVVDTLDGSADELFSAGAWVLVTHDWELEKKDRDLGTLVTAWKPVKHKLVKMAAGPAQVRVAVALKELHSGRTEVRVLGGIASRDKLGSVVLPLAQSAGRRECEGFVEDLKARALEQREADGAGSGGRRSTGEKR
jgi:hypothetical protein